MRSKVAKRSTAVEEKRYREDEWLQLANRIRRELSRIEEAAAARALPNDVVDDVKSAVDHCRTSLWAAAIFGALENSDDAAAMLVEARLQRTAEMCVRLQADVVAGRIGDATGCVRLCRRVLHDTVAALDSVKPLSAAEPAEPEAQAADQR